jgi:hypothetical protein
VVFPAAEVRRVLTAVSVLDHRVCLSTIYSCGLRLGACSWPEHASPRTEKREVHPAQCAPCDAPIFYASADGTGAPMRKEELVGRSGKQADGTAKTRQVYLGCVFTQHRIDEQGHPLRDYNSQACSGVVRVPKGSWR